jgi:hypothetical protein
LGLKSHYTHSHYPAFDNVNRNATHKKEKKERYSAAFTSEQNKESYVSIHSMYVLVLVSRSALPDLDPHPTELKCKNVKLSLILLSDD